MQSTKDNRLFRKPTPTEASMGMTDVLESYSNFSDTELVEYGFSSSKWVRSTQGATNIVAFFKDTQTAEAYRATQSGKEKPASQSSVGKPSSTGLFSNSLNKPPSMPDSKSPPKIMWHEDDFDDNGRLIVSRAKVAKHAQDTRIRLCQSYIAQALDQGNFSEAKHHIELAKKPDLGFHMPSEVIEEMEKVIEEALKKSVVPEETSFSSGNELGGKK